MGIIKFLFGQDNRSKAQRDQWHPGTIVHNLPRRKNNKDGTCFACDGKGKVTLDCNACGGTGVYENGKTCSKCKGAGRITCECKKCGGTGWFKFKK